MGSGLGRDQEKTGRVVFRAALMAGVRSVGGLKDRSGTVAETEAAPD